MGYWFDNIGWSKAAEVGRKKYLPEESTKMLEAEIHNQPKIGKFSLLGRVVTGAHIRKYRFPCPHTKQILDVTYEHHAQSNRSKILRVAQIEKHHWPLIVGVIGVAVTTVGIIVTIYSIMNGGG